MQVLWPLSLVGFELQGHSKLSKIEVNLKIWFQYIIKRCSFKKYLLGDKKNYFLALSLSHKKVSGRKKVKDNFNDTSYRIISVKIHRK